MTANHRALDESDIMLINRIRETTSLYDPSHPDFRFCQRKEETWHSLAASLGMNAIDAKRRWTCLRDRYSRELKQLRLHPEKEEYGKNDYFKQMDFLRAFVKIRKERRSKFNDVKSDTSSNAGKYESSIRKHEDEDSLGADKDMDATTHVFQISKSSFEGKEEITGSESTFPEYVEVDYDEYIESADPVAPADRSAKSINGNFVPIVLATTPPNHSLSNIPNKRPKIVLSQDAPSHSHQNEDDDTTSHNHSSNSQSEHNHHQHHHHQIDSNHDIVQDSAEDYFCKSIASYLRQLSRLNKIKAKVEMFQILEKYVELEENSN